MNSTIANCAALHAARLGRLATICRREAAANGRFGQWRAERATDQSACPKRVLELTFQVVHAVQLAKAGLGIVLRNFRIASIFGNGAWHATNKTAIYRCDAAVNGR